MGKYIKEKAHITFIEGLNSFDDKIIVLNSLRKEIISKLHSDYVGLEKTVAEKKNRLLATYEK